ncbi:TolC family protein [Vibrio sp. S9_S30]|uniref:TolC family protein n=1 Tax=Vibrio sp. S9_S30 TaxID=2720226 RepID=UPI001680845C|nr:TolC family protein [Vibrio sp. S9_S30]MBD1558865.1 TolC family protein [Vibrio sp. S9_S30]
MMKRPCAVLLGGLIALPFSTQSQPVSFDQAWQIVQQQSDALSASRANLQRYQHLQASKDRLNLPSITLSAHYTRLSDDVTLSAKQVAESSSIDLSGLGHMLPPSVIQSLAGASSTITEKDIFSSSIRAIWPIFTGGRITAAQEIAKGQTEEARSQLEMERQAKFDDLTQFYFSVVLAQQVVETRHAVEDGLRKHRDFALKMEKQGQIAKVERLQAEASLDKAKVDRKKAERDLDIAKTALASMLNVEDIQLQSHLFINDSLPPMSAFVDQTLKTYPGLHLLDAKEQQANHLVKAEDGKYFPNVYLYGDYTVYEHDSLASQMKPDWLVGIGVSIPLIDSSGRSERSQAAHSAVQQVQHLKAQARKDLQVFVEKTYLEAEQAKEEVNGLISSVNLAEENLKLRQRAFSQGLSNSLEVVDAQLYLASIKTQQHAARFHYLIALNKLLALSNEMTTFHQYEHRANLETSS